MLASDRAEQNVFIRHATKIAIGIITVLMLLAVLVFWRQAMANEEARGWVDHTYTVRRHIQLLLSGLQDAETGFRGYIQTGNKDFLEPYDNALRDTSRPNANNPFIDQHRSIKQELEILRGLTQDNVSQENNLDEVDTSVKDFLDFLSTVLQKRLTADNATRAKIDNEADFRHQRDLMDRLRGLIRIMDAEENHLLTLRTEVGETTARQNTILTLVAMAIFYAAIAISIVLYQGSRATAAAQMLIYTRELEKREEELKQQQEELKASNEEIEASNEELEEKTKALEEQNQRIRKQSKELEEAKHLIEDKADELERASRYKSEFLANMSHELRTPLNSLLILARGLAANEEGNLTAEQIEEAGVIYNGGLELLSLINDILDLSKVEAGKLNVIKEDIYINSFPKHISDQFGPVAKDKGVAFIVNVDASLPEMLNTDAQRVEQILKNLLSNAFKFTERGSVTLDIHRPGNKVALQRSSLSGSQAIAFAVTDTGIGIEESKFKDIFEAFQQENGSTDRHYGGTGLGLTIARKFAHLLGGEIHVASKKGSGSTFTLYLPLDGTSGAAQSAAPEAAAAAVRTPTAPANTVPPPVLKPFVPDDRKSIGANDKVLLIIEDDPDFASTLMKIAKKRGYKCVAAGDGKSALLLAADLPVTAIILDLRLPDIDGVRVLDHLKHDLKTRHIPVHIISAADESEMAAPLKKGAIGYLTKPVQMEDIDDAFSRIEGMLSTEVKRVLVVEDDKNTQAAIQSLLKQKNIEITTAGTGTVALTLAKDEHFDCVILDLTLPDMTGMQWLEAMERQSRGSNAPPIVIYTAKDLSEDENRVLSQYTGSIVIKGANSSERLLDEVTLFLHSVETSLSLDQLNMIRLQHNPDRALLNRSVLLVDDDMRNTFALSKLLKKHGMNVIIADNGQMALAKLGAEKSIELVIMDIMMPVMDGYEAMRAIRANKAWQTLPIIALTARAMPEEQERCIEAGANDYLTKPVDVERLLTLLRVWLFKHEMAA